MYKVIFVCISVLVIFLFACGNNQENKEEEYIFNPVAEDTVDSDEPLYPFVDYINGQLAFIDSTPFGIEKTISIDGKTIDSGFTSKTELRSLAQNFISTDPNQPDLKPRYRETSFNDLTLNRVTFTISAQDPELPLQQADILLNPENQKVKNVVLRKQFTQGDSSVKQHLVWVDKMHFQISETITGKDQKGYHKITRIVWDKPLE
jgi:hypothetical protein